MSDEETRRRHRERAWLAGGAGLTAVATIVGASARRSMIQRTTPIEDPYADEDFESLDSDRSYVVTTPDGVPLAVREVGPVDAPVTMFRVYWMWPGVSAMMNLRLGVAK